MTALENVAVPLELAGAADAFDRAAAELEAVGLGAARRPLPGAAVGRRAAAGGAGPRGWRRGRRSCWPTSRPAISTAPPAPASSTCCSAWSSGTARRWSWSPMMPALAARCARVVRLRDGHLAEPALARSRGMMLALRFAPARNCAAASPGSGCSSPAWRWASPPSPRWARCAKRSTTGLAREGAALLGGDAEIELTYRFASARRAGLDGRRRAGCRKWSTSARWR